MTQVLSFVIPRSEARGKAAIRQLDARMSSLPAKWLHRSVLRTKGHRIGLHIVVGDYFSAFVTPGERSALVHEDFRYVKVCHVHMLAECP